MCRSCSEGGRRCKSQQGPAKRQYQAGWKARKRAAAAFEGSSFGETLQPEVYGEEERLEGSNLDVFMRQNDPERVMRYFSDTSRILDLDKDQAALLHEKALEAIESIGPRARDEFNKLPGGDVGIESMVVTEYDKYLEPRAEEQYGAAKVAAMKGKRIAYLRSDEGKAEIARVDDEVFGPYELSVRELGRAMSVATVSSLAANGRGFRTEEVDEWATKIVKEKSSYKARVDRAHADVAWAKGVLTDEFMDERVLSKKSIEDISDEFRARIPLSEDDLMDVVDSVVKNMDRREFPAGLGTPNPRTQVYVFRKGLRRAWENGDIERKIVSSAEEISDREMFDAVRVGKEEFDKNLLSSYRKQLAKQLSLGESDPSSVLDSISSDNCGEKDRAAVARAFGDAMSFYPQSYVDAVSEKFDRLEFGMTDERAYFSQSKSRSVETGSETAVFVPLSGEFYKSMDEADRPWQPIAGKDEGKTSFFTGDDFNKDSAQHYLKPATDESRGELQKFVDRYNERVERYNAGEGSEDGIFNDDEMFFMGGKRSVEKAKVISVEQDGQEFLAVVTDVKKEKRSEPYQLAVVSRRGRSDDKELSSAAVHEYGHAVEHAVPEIHKATNYFLRRRTRGQKEMTYDKGVVKERQENRVASMAAPEETVVPDGFTDPYIGKTSYRNGATEVFTMAMESLVHGRYAFTRNSANFVAEHGGSDDPEHRDLVLGALMMSKF